MSLTATERQVVSATVSVRVPRGEAGNLDSGVVNVIENVDAVESVALEHVASVRPTWTDIHVDADVRLDPAGDRDVEDLDAIRMLLADGFGVEDVSDLSVERSADQRG